MRVFALLFYTAFAKTYLLIERIEDYLRPGKGINRMGLLFDSLRLRHIKRQGIPSSSMSTTRSGTGNPHPALSPNGRGGRMLTSVIFRFPYSFPLPLR